jgi:hypothetical protein
VTLFAFGNIPELSSAKNSNVGRGPGEIVGGEVMRPVDETRNTRNFIGNESVGHRQEIGTRECIINHDFPLNKKINLGILFADEN